MRASALAAFLVLGCSVVDAPGQHQAMPIQSTSACSEVSNAICAVHAHCCPRSNPSLCASVASALCQASLGDALAYAGNGYDPFVGGTVLNHMRAAGASCDAEYLALLTSQAGLTSVFAGSLGSGAACADAMGHYQPFVCETPDLACNPTDLHCGPRQQVGAMCLASRDCVDSLYCHGASGTTPGTCSPRLPAGGTCTGHDECASFMCLTGHCGDASNAADVLMGICSVGA